MVTFYRNKVSSKGWETPPCFKVSAKGASRQRRMMQKYHGNTRDHQGTDVVTRGQQVMAAPNTKDC